MLDGFTLGCQNDLQVWHLHFPAAFRSSRPMLNSPGQQEFCLVERAEWQSGSTLAERNIQWQMKMVLAKRL
jgi:hypothetical protein